MKKMCALQPMVGQVYRDMKNCSFIVLSNRERIFVEYADGHFERLQPKEWEKLGPSIAAF
ncbi:MAG: hypothetical protein A2286_12140 [Gammaproteobacteria bacterium RIFOXYA12_FULL_61_12]|nr:MAG: hypothetical protein A2286_12140 [Gammaproteobacteria bacterium RIFOXYA12_FULL_61_12]OGT90965.1 MAG: hypothetical protein A2514_07595 [Gammaproteobacteria bacterium RIFOXYD12_FULL_61_37]